jgi:hypothetical protein
LLISGNFNDHRTLTGKACVHSSVILIYSRDNFSSLWLIDNKHILIWVSKGKEEFTPCYQAVFSIVDCSQFWNLELKELSWFFLSGGSYVLICKLCWLYIESESTTRFKNRSSHRMMTSDWLVDVSDDRYTTIEGWPDIWTVQTCYFPE